MRTVVSHKTGMTWRLCSWNDACQIPVTLTLDEKQHYCRWHARCLQLPQIASNRDAFEMYLDWMQQAYPSTGWWGWPVEQLWPVLQGTMTVFQAEDQAA